MTYPKKETPTDAPIIDVIRDRWSPVTFSDKPIGDDKIKSLFEAARWAPSNFGEEPWMYIYAEKKDAMRPELESLLVEGNAWAKNAGLLILSFSKKTFKKNGKVNDYYRHDTGAASFALVLQATALGLISHQMSGFDHEKANGVLGVPDDFAPSSMIAIGEMADPKGFPEAMQQRDASPRKRNPVSEFAFRGEYQGK